ncbi:hypothetical protein CASFOL_041173 [Castilleja foliolosa]|uniref:Protein farnesyltransferase/geranylgeranyltransferase type-1 subunit alpha n=1 Tax=Castilleja foliolosa TaxID=1961234 RepID=A0ABD3BFD8_9LAMI
MDSTWRERKSKVEELGSTEEALFDELKYTAKLLHKDSRNKYAWSHRQWALEKLGRGYADELGFCNQMLKHEHNAHNRLIWDQKFFAVQKCLTKGMTIIRSCEVNVAMHAILDYPEDENPWRYLRLLYKNDMKALARHEKTTRIQEIRQMLYLQKERTLCKTMPKQEEKR